MLEQHLQQAVGNVRFQWLQTVVKAWHDAADCACRAWWEWPSLVHGQAGNL
jgi:hypothetical protein